MYLFGLVAQWWEMDTALLEHVACEATQNDSSHRTSCPMDLRPQSFTRHIICLAR